MQKKFDDLCKKLSEEAHDEEISVLVFVQGDVGLCTHICSGFSEKALFTALSVIQSEIRMRSFGIQEINEN